MLLCQVVGDFHGCRRALGLKLLGECSGVIKQVEPDMSVCQKPAFLIIEIGRNRDEALLNDFLCMRRFRSNATEWVQIAFTGYTRHFSSVSTYFERGSEKDVTFYYTDSQDAVLHAGKDWLKLSCPTREATSVSFWFYLNSYRITTLPKQSSSLFEDIACSLQVVDLKTVEMGLLSNTRVNPERFQLHFFSTDMHTSDTLTTHAVHLVSKLNLFRMLVLYSQKYTQHSITLYLRISPPGQTQSQHFLS